MRTDCDVIVSSAVSSTVELETGIVLTVVALATSGSAENKTGKLSCVYLND